MISEIKIIKLYNQTLKDRTLISYFFYILLVCAIGTNRAQAEGKNATVQKDSDKSSPKGAGTLSHTGDRPDSNSSNLLNSKGIIPWERMSLMSIGGKPFPTTSLKGKIIVVVNTASQCGYTPQLKDLQNLYEKYRDRGVVVLGFPSDDFRQDPAANQDIAKFCEVNYGVKFPLFAKGAVSGGNAQPLFQWLNQQIGEVDKLEPKDIKWNFEKFVIGKDGRLVARFRSGVEPLGAQMVQVIEQALKAP